MLAVDDDDKYEGRPLPLSIPEEKADVAARQLHSGARIHECHNPQDRNEKSSAKIGR
jgi:hypothetical protein